jgi:hypothetical protein
MNEVILYDDKWKLKDYELLFLQSFKDTHNLASSLALLQDNEKRNVKAGLKNGRTDLGKAFKEFVEDAPIHPEANKVVILDNLIWVMNQAKIDQDTNGVIRAISEINKMIKGNLTVSQENKIVKQTLIGIVDFTKKEVDDNTLDVTYTEQDG